MSWLVLLVFFSGPAGLFTDSQPGQNARKTGNEQATVSYPNTPEGLQGLIRDILRATRAKDKEKQAELIHSLLIPEDSSWFTDEYGSGFGKSLSAAYQRGRAPLEEEIKTVYEGDSQKGWAAPNVLRYSDPDKASPPLDRFLNCMNEIVPLYSAAFQGNVPTMIMPLKAGQLTQASGDLDGYFIYDRGSFRFIPYEIFMKLPLERPVRIQLDMNTMESKLIAKVPVEMPQEAIRKRISGKVVIQVVIDVSGNAKELKVLEGDPILSSAVLKAVRQWRFAPTTLDGDPVEVDLRVPFVFERFQ